MRTDPVAALDWRKARRKRAWELHAQGWSQHCIAQAFGVSQAAVSRWFAAGQDCLGVGSRHGAAPKLDAARLRLLPDLLSHGAEVWGFRGELWTCARVAAVIQEESGVSDSRAHVSRLLKALDWTPQKPIERASQRDEAAIAHWREVRWPELKRGRSQTTGAECLSTRAASTCCLPPGAPMLHAGRLQSCGRRAATITSRSWRR